MLRKVAYALGLLAILAVVACGSSDDGTEETTTPSEQTDVLERLAAVPEATVPAPARSSLRDVFDDVQAMWRGKFDEAGAEYKPATLTIFHDHVDTACGAQSANVDRKSVV